MFRFIKRWLPAKDEVTKPKAVAKQAIEMLRREYTGEPLLESNVDPNPIAQFINWFDEALKQIKDDPNAMILSTADADGRPSSRTVLLKGYNEEGFIFYTNYASRKAIQIAENPNVSITFYWPELMRQIHIEGVAEKVSAERSDAYFKTRPDGSKISAWATYQSRPVSSRDEFENRRKEIEDKFIGKEITRPPTWGGYIIKPKRIEFWQGRLNRLHDRICYIKSEEIWKIIRLSP